MQDKQTERDTQRFLDWEKAMETGSTPPSSVTKPATTPQRTPEKRSVARVKRPRMKNHPSSTSTSVSSTRKDDFSDKQERIHRATAKGASWLHLAGGAVLGAVQTFFKRTFLSVVAAIALIGGMLLAGVGYSIALGFLPQELFPQDKSIADIYVGVITWFSTAPDWMIGGCVGAIALAICVQAYQSWTVATFLNMKRSSASGGKGIFSNWVHRFLFFAVSGLVWFLDFQAISGVSFAGGIAGLALWLWAAFPSEIAAMILQIQKSANDD